MTAYRLISADSHVSEPPNLWAEGVDKTENCRGKLMQPQKFGAPAQSHSTRKSACIFSG